MGTSLQDMNDHNADDEVLKNPQLLTEDLTVNHGNFDDNACTDHQELDVAKEEHYEG